MQSASEKPVLSVETATPVCSVALRLPDGNVHEERAEGKGIHSELTFVFIQKLLNQHDLEVDELGGVLVSSGPGSFTGLRVASSAVKGLLFNVDIPLYACHTLAGMAAGVWSRHFSGERIGEDNNTMIAHTVIDARRSHLYHQSWQVSADGIVPENIAKARSLDDLLPMWSDNAHFFGTGVNRLQHHAGLRGFRGGARSGSNDLRIISSRNYFMIMDLSYNTSSISYYTDTFIKKVNANLFEPDYYT